MASSLADMMQGAADMISAASASFVQSVDVFAQTTGLKPNPGGRTNPVADMMGHAVEKLTGFFHYLEPTRTFTPGHSGNKQSLPGGKGVTRAQPVPQNVVHAAASNISMVAEAQVRLAAAGQVSIDSLSKSVEAIKALTVARESTTKAARGESNEEKQTDKATKTVTKAWHEVRMAALTAGAGLMASAFSIRKFVGAASPQLVGALSTSMELLSAKIGGALMPVMDSAIDLVQDACDWWDTLSESTQTWIAAGVVAVPALLGLTKAIIALGPVAKLTAAAVKMAVASMAASKLAMGAGIVGAATAAVFAMVEATKMLDKPNQDHSRFAHTNSRVTEEEYKNGEYGNQKNNRVFQQLLTLPEAERKKLALEKAAFSRQQAKEARSHWWVPEGTAKDYDQNAEMFERIAKHGVQSKGEGDWRKQVKRQYARTTAVTKENRPQYSGLADARKNLQLAALGKNSFEQQLLKEQRKHRQEEIKRLDELIQEGKKKGHRLYE